MADDDRPDKLMVPRERVFGRGQGCWNCMHWDRDRIAAYWTEKRQRDLATALSIAITSKHGENDQRVFNIRKNVNDIDHLVAQKYVGLCKGGGVDRDDNPVELVHHAYKCHKWTGVQGSSLASDGKQDPLPGELRDKIDN